MNVPSVNRGRKPLALLVLLPLLCGTGCVSHLHSVGLGATGTRVVSARQWYLFFGLWRVNEVDTQRMAPDLTSYTIETGFEFVDLLLFPVLLPFTVTTRTVVVRT